MHGKTMNPTTTNEIATNTAMYGGGGAAITIWGLGLSDIAAIISALVAVGGFVLHVIVTQERRKRERELHELTKAQLRGELVRVETKGVDAE